MGLFNFFRKQPEVVEERSYYADALNFSSYSTYQQNRSMLLSCVYRCVDVISDSLAALDINLYYVDSEGFKLKSTDELSYILNVQPNSKMSRFTFMKLMVANMLLKGDAYALIKRDNKGNVTELVYLPYESVTTIETVDSVRYKVVGLKNYIEDKDMLHILNFTYDGIHGVSTLRHATKSLSLATAAEDAAEGFYKGGGNLAGVLTVEGTLTEKQRQALKTSWTQAYGGGNNANGVAILEGNMKYNPIQVNPADAQLLDTRKYNIVDICRFFGVSPTKVFDLTHSSYSTVEASNISFLTDTLNPLIIKFENELKRKLIIADKKTKDISFDTSILLRTDKKSLAEYYRTLMAMGILSINEVRQQLDLGKIEGGDMHTVQVNLVDINRLNEVNYKDKRLGDLNNQDNQEGD